MRIVNITRKKGERFQAVAADCRIAGNKDALRAIANACLEALVKGSASCDLLDTKGDSYSVGVEVVSAIADLVKLPLE